VTSMDQRRVRLLKLDRTDFSGLFPTINFGIGAIDVISILCLSTAASLRTKRTDTIFAFSLTSIHGILHTSYTTHDIRCPNDAIRNRLFGGASCGYGIEWAWRERFSRIKTIKKRMEKGMEMSFLAYPQLLGNKARN